MIKKLDKLMCTSCESQWWTKIEDGKVCNCPQCGGTKHEKVDEWEVKPPPVVQQMPSLQSTHAEPDPLWAEVTTAGMVLLR